MKKECDIIKDVLPLYIEGLHSEGTDALVKEHIERCTSCRKEYELMKSDNIEEESRTEEKKLSDKPFVKIMNRLNRKFYLLSYAVIFLFLMFGFTLTEGADVMVNSIIMPIVGAFSYFVFGWRSVYKSPGILVAANVVAVVSGYIDIELISIVGWTAIYGIFLFTGIGIVFLFRYALKGEIK